MRTATKRAAAPGYATAAKRNRCQRGCPATNRLSCVECVRKDTEESSITQEPQLFDAAGNPSSDNSEMAAFFDAVRPLVADFAPADRLSVIAGIYEVYSGTDRETISGILKPRLRAVFGDIVNKMQL